MCLFHEYLIEPFNSVVMRTVISDRLTAGLQCQEVSVLILGKLVTLLNNGRQYFLFRKTKEKSKHWLVRLFSCVLAESGLVLTSGLE